MNVIEINSSWLKELKNQIRRWLITSIKKITLGKHERKIQSPGDLRTCHYCWNYSDNTLQFDKHLPKILGFSTGEAFLLPQQKNLLEMINNKDMYVMLRKIRKCVQGDTPFFHCKINAYDKNQEPLFITMYGKANYQCRTISGSFLLLDPDFEY